MVADALREGDGLPDSAPICSSEAEDIYLRKPGNRVASSSFSTVDTWEALHPRGETVFWHRQVWFQGRIPKHTFITWVLASNRLGTRDRMRSWGLQVPENCILCNTEEDTKQHLFFYCSFSSEVWCFFCSRLSINPPTLFEDCLRWLSNPSSDEFVKLIIKLV